MRFSNEFIISALIDFWKLLRGTPHSRFAVALVRCGTILIAGPSAYLLIVLAVLDRAAPSPGKADINTLLSVGAFCVGVSLIGVGIWIFHRFRLTILITDDFKVFIPGGWPFDHVAAQIVSDKIISFENFLPQHKSAPLRGQEVTCGSPMNALRLLGHLVAEPDFPQYSVHEEGGRVIIRAHYVTQNSNADTTRR